jgi:hypothetical protein
MLRCSRIFELAITKTEKHTMDKKLILPREGQGLHDAILKYSRGLLLEGYDVEQTTNMLIKATQESCRTTQDLVGEIQNAVVGAREFLDDNPSFRYSKVNRKPNRWNDPLSFLNNRDGMCRSDRRDIRSAQIDFALRKKALANDREIVLSDQEFSFKDLFAGINFKICASKDKYSAPVKKLNDWNIDETFPRMQYIVPNYFWESSAEGGDKSDFNIGRRLFLVVEFDRDSLQDQIALLDFLHNDDFRLIMIVYSGHRSLHGWFTCYGRSEYRVVGFCIKAKMLGADKSTYSPSQYCRMPNGWNPKYKKHQKVIHFDKLALHWQNDLIRSDLL